MTGSWSVHLSPSLASHAADWNAHERSSSKTIHFDTDASPDQVRWATDPHWMQHVNCLRHAAALGAVSILRAGIDRLNH